MSEPSHNFIRTILQRLHCINPERSSTMPSLSKIIVAVLGALAPSLVSGFTFGIRQCNTRLLSTQINIFGNAFANDDSLGKKENPGLKKVIFDFHSSRGISLPHQMLFLSFKGPERKRSNNQWQTGQGSGRPEG